MSLSLRETTLSAVGSSVQDGVPKKHSDNSSEDNQMQAVTGVVRNGRLDLNEPINLPNGTSVEITVLPKRVAPATSEAAGQTSYRDFILSIAGSFGDEPFERPDQGVSEIREDW